ncbi:hypothetical protein J4G33_11390 [Actinotalea sp. BY-33]|uniref:Uncharacterized protein n=1 Tax=Actinotalea soli TaxID=2819234 RepID=A0A939LUJ9_9CELL|nr:hypothetical protein [Actinotalea soli]MBO1752404.1 hypothetical protein [Actinotalea soli]
MTRPSDELAQVGELPSTTLGAIDAEINNLGSTAAALGAAAQRLNGVLSDTGIEGRAGDSAAIAFEGLIAQTKKQIELIETTAAAAQAAKGALSEARSAYAALPEDQIPTWQRSAILAGSTVMGPLGVLAGNEATQYLDRRQREARDDAARPALTSLRAQMRAAAEALPVAPGREGYDNGDSGSVPGPTPSTTPHTPTRASGSYNPITGGGPALPASASASIGTGPGATTSPGVVLGGAAGAGVGVGVGTVAGGLAAGGRNTPGTVSSGWAAPTGGSGSADGSLTGSVPGQGMTGGTGAAGTGGGTTAGGVGGAGGALAGGVAVGGAALGAGLGRGGALGGTPVAGAGGAAAGQGAGSRGGTSAGLGAGLRPGTGLGTPGAGSGGAGGASAIGGRGGTFVGAPGAVGASTGASGAAAGGTNGTGAGARTGALSGSTGSGLTAGSSTQAGAGATGGRGSTMAGMPMGAGGAAGSSAGKKRRSGAGYLAPHLADDSPNAPAPAAAAGSRDRLPDLVAPPVTDTADEDW